MNRRTFVSASFQAAAALGLAPQASAASNDRIERARQSALDALKPSKKQIEHGLALHAGSIVMEAYGFAPRCAIDGDATRAAIAAGASDLELQDLHEDMIMTRCVTSATERTEFLNAWTAAGVTCIFQNAAIRRNCRCRAQFGSSQILFKTHGSESFWLRRRTSSHSLQTRRGHSSDCRYWRLRRYLLYSQFSWPRGRHSRLSGSHRSHSEALRRRPRRDWHRYRIIFRLFCGGEQEGRPTSQIARAIRGFLAAGVATNLQSVRLHPGVDELADLYHRNGSARLLRC
jgi:hypothetical protein